MIAQALGHAPEVAIFPCVDPVETAAALQARTSVSPEFAALLAQAVSSDRGRGVTLAPTEPAKRFTLMLERLGTDPLWTEEYDEYVRNVSFATALDTVTRLTGSCI